MSPDFLRTLIDELLPGSVRGKFVIGVLDDTAGSFRRRFVVAAELPIMTQVTGALAGRCARVFARVVMHVPRKTTEPLQQEIERVNADCVVSFGGGSPIDSCKAAVFGLLPKRELIHIHPHHAFGRGVHLCGPCNR